MTTDEQAIRQVIAGWIRATEEGDVETLADLMTDEMVFLTVGNPPMTKAMFLEGMRATLPALLIQTESEIREVRVEGGVGWCWHDLIVRMTPRAGGEPKELRGTTLGIYQRGGDGRWSLHRDANLMGG